MLNHTGTIPLETERLALRRFTPDDAKAMFANWTGDPEVSRYMRWQPHAELKDTCKMLCSWMISYDKESFYQWAIVPKGEDEPIGGISLFTANEYDQCGDVAYVLGRKYWGRGIVAEALDAVLRHAFETVGYNRVEAFHSVNNPASGRVMEKCGMVKEGTCRQAYKSNVGFQDSHMYGILKEDWDKLI